MGVGTKQDVCIERLVARTHLSAVKLAEFTNGAFPRVISARGGVLHTDVYSDTDYSIDYDSTRRSDGTISGTQTVDYREGGLYGPQSVELHAGSGDWVFLRGLGVFSGNRATNTTKRLKDNFRDITKVDETVWDREDVLPAIIAFDGAAYFAADDWDGGTELWRSKGTAASTQRVKDIAVDASSNPAEFVAGKGKFYFTAATTAAGARQIWSSDGTSEGTLAVTNIKFTGADTGVRILGAAGGKIIFAAKSALYALGTADNSVALLSAVAPGAGVSTGQRVYFQGTDTAHGTEMWTTDGTAAGTYLVKDARPGPESGLDSSDYSLNGQPLASRAVIGNSLYYRSWDASNARLLVSDGTAAGTFATDSLNPEHLTAHAGKVYFNSAQSVYSYSPGGALRLLATLPAFATVEGMQATDNKLFVDSQSWAGTRNDRTIYSHAIWAVDTHLGVIKGSVFNDGNANGIPDVGEGALAGYKVFIDRNIDGICNTNEVSTRANARGQYRFDGLGPGQYNIRIVGVEGLRASTAEAYHLKLAEDATVTRNFGRTAQALVAGLVYMDANKNGTIDDGESGMGGWTVYIDADGDGVLDLGELSIVTDAAGKFAISVPAGSWRVRAVPQAKYRQTSPGAGYRSVSIVAAGISGKVNFGEKRIA